MASPYSFFRILIGYCLSCTADTALDKSKEWIELAQQAGIESDVEQVVLRFIATADDLEETEDLNKEVTCPIRLYHPQWLPPNFT